MDPREATRRIKESAFALGFDRVGVAPVGPGAAREASDLREWLRRGWHGEMAYMADRIAERERPDALLPGARSVVCVALNYFPGPESPVGPERGQISRYARGDDYHDVLKDRLFPLRDRIAALLGCAAKVCVDTSPVLEKVWAQRAGLGWQGKHTLLIDPQRGSYFFLGEVLVAAELAYEDEPAADHCGTCTACLDACPTDALPEPGRLDSNRCIAYLTIEHRGPIDPALRPLMGNWIFGCDDCQTACPWNRFAVPTAVPELRPRAELANPALAELLPMDAGTFASRHRRTPVKRAKRSGFLRNVAIALGNSGAAEAVPALIAGLDDPDPLVRGHAAWGLGRLGGEQARTALAGKLASELDPFVREELSAALARPRRHQDTKK